MTYEMAVKAKLEGAVLFENDEDIVSYLEGQGYTDIGTSDTHSFRIRDAVIYISGGMVTMNIVNSNKVVTATGISPINQVYMYKGMLFVGAEVKP